jgi:hypothetical protein
MGFSVAVEAGDRKFYLTTQTVKGNAVLTACANGYHTASLYEILDPSNFIYNTKLGFTWPDGDGGPPGAAEGWVRTGNFPSNSSQTAGVDNCNTWTTTSGYGTIINLDDTWQDIGGTEIDTSPWSPWERVTVPCDFNRFVWCVEDN